MVGINQTKVKDAKLPDPKWKDLYRVGSISCIVFTVALVFAVIAYFIWPYTPGLTTVEDIFALLQSNKLGGLMLLDFSMTILLPLSILQTLALYVALKRVNESYALIALVLGLMGIVLIFTARPWVEIAYFSDQYAIATSDTAKNQYLAAGEVFHALFTGTSWVWWNILNNISIAISSLLMLRSKVFSKAIAYVGIVLAISGLCWFLPVIGPYLSLLVTVGAVVFYAMLARAFFRLGWRDSTLWETEEKLSK